MTRLPEKERSLPPLEERDGTAARARAADGADWQPVGSMDGHTYWFPPEVGHLAAPGAPWDALEALLRLTLHVRGTAGSQAKATRQSRRFGAATEAALFVLGAYARMNPGFKPAASGTAMATRLLRFAREHRVEGADALDPENMFGRLMDIWIEGYNSAARYKSAAVPKPKSNR
ncbi:MAG TPA: hypothetical protein VIJ55_03705 [Acetobacteraceae bacterium]